MQHPAPVLSKRSVHASDADWEALSSLAAELGKSPSQLARELIKLGLSLSRALRPALAPAPRTTPASAPTEPAAQPTPRPTPKPVPASPKKRWVYFVQDEGHPEHEIKIGVADDVEERIKALSTGRSLPLVCLHKIEGDREMELGFHRMFQHVRVKGEWFLPGPVISFLKSIGALPAGKGASHA
jgi:hypothetical protein